MERVASFVPDLAVRIKAMPVDAIISLCKHVERIPDNLVRIKSIFPEANAAQLAA